MNTVEMKFEDMKSLSGCIDRAAAYGYREQFAVDEEGLKTFHSGRHYVAHDVKIMNFYRFEGNSDPEDNSIMYFLETSDGIKGILVDAYGAYADSKVAAFIVQVEKLHEENSSPTG